MIPFIRVYPNGTNRISEVERPEEIERLAALFLEREGRYLLKIEDNGRVHLAAAVMENGEPFEAALVECDNGPELFDAVDKLVRTSVENQTKFLKGAKPPFVESVEAH